VRGASAVPVDRLDAGTGRNGAVDHGSERLPHCLAQIGQLSEVRPVPPADLGEPPGDAGQPSVGRGAILQAVDELAPRDVEGVVQLDGDWFVSKRATVRSTHLANASTP
jgi:hypothetical protein